MENSLSDAIPLAFLGDFFYSSFFPVYANSRQNKTSLNSTIGFSALVFQMNGGLNNVMDILI